MPVTSRIGSAVELAIFSTICAGAVSLYGYKKLTQKKKAPLIIQDDDCLKVVVISGCDRGLGLLMARTLSQMDGYHVVALTLSADKKLEGNITTIQCDVTSDEAVQAMKAQVQQLLLFVDLEC